MRNKSVRADATLALARLLEHARYEVLPTATTEEKVLDAPAPRPRGHVTASPSKGLEATLDLAERLAGHGYAVVPAPRRADDHRPHRARRDLRPARPARASPGSSCPGGDAEPAGDYPDALALLEDLADARAARSPRSASPATRSPTPPSTTT